MQDAELELDLELDDDEDDELDEVLLPDDELRPEPDDAPLTELDDRRLDDDEGGSSGPQLTDGIARPLEFWPAMVIPSAPITAPI